MSEASMYLKSHRGIMKFSDNTAKPQIWGNNGKQQGLWKIDRYRHHSLEPVRFSSGDANHMIMRDQSGLAFQCYLQRIWKSGFFLWTFHGILLVGKYSLFRTSITSLLVDLVLRLLHENSCVRDSRSNEKRNV